MRGILQGYVTREEALPLVRGHVRIANQLARRPGMLLPIEVRYDEYDVDVAENRILRSALRRMLDESRRTLPPPDAVEQWGVLSKPVLAREPTYALDPSP